MFNKLILIISRFFVYIVFLEGFKIVLQFIFKNDETNNDGQFYNDFLFDRIFLKENSSYN